MPPSRNRGRRKPSLRDLSRDIPSLAEQAKFADKMVKTQDPIVVAIIGQSLIENDLDELLKPHFRRSDDETWESLTSEVGPLSTFHRKVIIASAFGIFKEPTLNNIHIVRKIRNAFAHSRGPLDFSNDLILAELTKIKPHGAKKSRAYQNLSDGKGLAQYARDNPKRDDTLGRIVFVGLCLAVSTALASRMTERLKAKHRRRERTYRNQLIGGLLSPRPGEPLNRLANPSRPQSGGLGGLFGLGALAEIPPEGEGPPRKKGK